MVENRMVENDAVEKQNCGKVENQMLSTSSMWEDGG